MLEFDGGQLLFLAFVELVRFADEGAIAGGGHVVGVVPVDQGDVLVKQCAVVVKVLRQLLGREFVQADELEFVLLLEVALDQPKPEGGEQCDQQHGASGVGFLQQRKGQHHQQVGGEGVDQ